MTRQFILPLLGLTLAQGAVIDHPVQVKDLFAPLERRALPQLHGFFDGSTLNHIQTGFRDMVTVGRAIIDIWDDDPETYDRVLDEYFDTKSDCDVGMKVYEMFEAMVIASEKGAGEYGSENVGRIILDADDFKNWDHKVNAYATVNDKERQTRMHISPKGLQYPPLAQVHCDSLGDTVSNRMVTFGGFVLTHELTHAPELARGVMAQSSCQFEGTEDLPLPDDATVLRKRAEAPLAVGPQYTRALRQSPTQGEKAICNAENYAWFATELYWSHVCGKTFKPPTSNDYAPPGGFSG